MSKCEKGEKRKNTPAFLRNTYQMLQREQLKSIVCWSQGGNGFIIKNLQLFEKEVLRQYFKHQKYTSFVRQLNMYGFHKQKQKYHSSYHYFGHESFRRGDVQQHDKIVALAAIKRKPEKKKKMEEITIKQNQQSGQSQGIIKQDSQQSMRSVSLALEQDKIKEQEIPKEESVQSKRQSVSEDRHSQYRSQSRQQMQEEEMIQQLGNQATDNLLQLTIRQNESLRNVHSYIRQAVLNFSTRSIEKVSGKWNIALQQQQTSEVNRLVCALNQQSKTIKAYMNSQSGTVEGED